MSETPAAPPAPAPAPAQAQLAASNVPKLELKYVYMSYTDRKGRTVQAVEDVSLTIANKPGIGELAVFLGPSGCGKSTILKAVCGLLAWRPTLLGPQALALLRRTSVAGGRS
jgi:ABC-type glutathione transport system ATPase component